MSRRKKIEETTLRTLTAGRLKPWDEIHDIHTDSVISLGGTELRICQVPGHTPGSIVILETRENYLFTGDAIGSVVEAVIAARTAVGLFVPEIEAVAQRLTLVGAGKVDDHGRAAADGAARARFKIVGRGGVADVEIKMRVGVDKAREEQLAADVHDGGPVRGQMFADLDDGFPVDQKIGDTGTGCGDDGAAFE